MRTTKTPSTMRLVVCTTLVAVVFGQRPLPGLVRQQNVGTGRQLVNQGFGNQIDQGFGGPVNQGFGNQVDQGFGNQGNQGFGRQQDIAPVRPSPVRPIARQQVPISRQEVFVNQEQSDILEDIRDGPFWDGSYYFRYQSSDGTIREEGGRPLFDGTIQVTGSYGYRAPNGEIFEMEYIADTQGYRAFPKGTRADFVPPQRAVAPQGLPPFNQDFNQDFVQPRPQPSIGVRPRPINNRPVNINAVNLNGIRPTPGNFQGQFQGFGANLSGAVPFGGQQVNRDGGGAQDNINFPGDDTFLPAESRIN